MSRNQLNVFKDFIRALDGTSSSGENAANEAIVAASNFSGLDDLIENFLADRANESSGTKFLKKYCGIDLNNKDTGAITGYDAGVSKTQKTAKSIVPETSPKKSTYPPDTSFSYKGLTINVPDKSTLDSTQQKIVAGIYTWWLKAGLDLAEKSLGINFRQSDVTFNTIDIDFDLGDEDGSYFSFWSNSYGEVTRVVYHINSDDFTNLKNTDMNGTDKNGDYFDRSFARLLGIGLVMSNVSYEWELPSTIGQGYGEFISGADNKHKARMRELVNNYDLLESYAHNGRGNEGLQDIVYYDQAFSYMLLRYMTKQAVTPVKELPTGLSYNKSKTTITASKYFKGSTIDLTQYSAKTKNLNTSVVSRALTITGNSLNNSIQSGKGKDTITGGEGKDTIRGGAGNDSVFGDNDADILFGDAGKDTVYGGEGNDTLFGNAGNDVLIGGADNDTLYGGDGKDTFVHYEGTDFIADYQPGKDKIKLEDYTTITDSQVKGKHVILTTDTGKIIIKNGKGKKITVTDSYGDTTTKIYNNASNLAADSTKNSAADIWFTDENNFSTADNLSAIVDGNLNSAVADEIPIYQTDSTAQGKVLLSFGK